MGRETAALASLYLTHAAVGGLAGQQLDEAEKSYILWDWEGLAPLAYEQFLKFGRGAFIGPRTVVADDSFTVAFDYVREGLRMVQISKDPFVPTVQARLRCARYCLSPNF